MTRMALWPVFPSRFRGCRDVGARAALELCSCWRGPAGLATSVIRRVHWRGLLATQAIAALIAVPTWLTSGHDATPAFLVHLLCAQALTALLVLAAAPAADQAVRRGWSVLYAFVVAILGVSVTNAAAQWVLHAAFQDTGASQPVAIVINDLFSVTTIWGVVLLVYLNRQSATRLLARLRADELEHVAAEHAVITSRLREIEARMDSAAVLRQLAEIRSLYARGQEGADGALENLITALQDTVVSVTLSGNHKHLRGDIRP